jgi:hypothetical protein
MGRSSFSFDVYIDQPPDLFDFQGCISGEMCLHLITEHIYIYICGGPNRMRLGPWRISGWVCGVTVSWIEYGSLNTDGVVCKLMKKVPIEYRHLKLSHWRH